MATATPLPASSTLATATQISTEEWRKDMGTLFEHARERFADVVWELGDDADNAEEVWGHKAIVYARAPPSFQARYFKFRPAPSASPSPYGASPLDNGQSSYSLALPSDDVLDPSRSPSPFATRRVMSPAPSSIAGQILRLQTNIAPVLFTNELEYLYTGKGFSDAFEFLFDSPEKMPEAGNDNDEASRIDKLRNDLIYMWRSRLYSDVRVTLTGNFPTTRDSEAVEEVSTAVFSSHKFILVSRSQYFRDRLQSLAFATPNDDNQVTLPSPPFTPASIHFTLGYIYTGTLSFSHRSFDLTTAFHIFRSATYLQLDPLYKEIEARVVEEMMHGLFHAFLPFDQYEKITAGRWGVGGCKCRQCQRRAPRVLEFAISPDVSNPILTRGAQRALSGMFGEGWCFPEFAALPAKSRSNLVKGVGLRATSINVIPLLFAAQAAMYKLENNNETWAEEIREMILTVRKKIDDTMCTSCEEVFEQEEWVAILERDGAVFGDAEKVGWAMDSLRRGLSDRSAGFVYQTIVSAVLIRPHPTTGSTLLPPTSVIRAAVERARMEILKWIGRQKRWQFVHAAGGFEECDDWALKEISHEIDVPMELLQAPVPNGGTIKGQPRPYVSANNQRIPGDNESVSISSLHSNARGRQVSNGTKEATPSAISKSNGSVVSTASRMGQRYNGNGPSAPPPAPSSTSRGAPAARLKPILSSRLQSMASQPAHPSIHEPPPSATGAFDDGARTSYAPTSPSGTPTTPGIPLPGESTAEARGSPGRPKSIAPSVASVRSTTSTVRKGQASLAVPGPSPNGAGGRPESSMSARSDASTTFKTAKSELTAPSRSRYPTSTPNSPAPGARAPRQRTNSTASNVSAVSARSTATAGRARDASGEKAVPSAPKPLRPRRSSVASVTSTKTPKTTRKQAGARPPLPSPEVPALPLKGVARTASTSTASAATPRRAQRQSPSDPETRRRADRTLDSGAESLYPDVAEGADAALVLIPPAYTSHDMSSPGRTSLAFPIPPVDLKGKGKESSYVEDLASRPHSLALRLSTGTARSDGASTVKAPNGDEVGDRRRRNSGDTITESTMTVMPNGTLRPPKRPPPPIPRSRRGITLNVGIPCIISSKRARFRAFARYIGEVDGEVGPWVGVEVPVDESWKDDKLSGRDWNDGSLNGTRYFDIDGTHAVWDEADQQRAARRRRVDVLFSDKSSVISRKREGDQLTVDRDRLKRLRSASPAVSDTSTSAEVRGLFVRPQQVIYVVNAAH